MRKGWGMGVAKVDTDVVDLPLKTKKELKTRLLNKRTQESV